MSRRGTGALAILAAGALAACSAQLPTLEGLSRIGQQALLIDPAREREIGFGIATTSHAVTADDYPAISIRLQEQGTVAIRFVINPEGTVDECAIATTSGKPRLDEAACTMVKKRGKYKPATQDGKPVAQNTTANVVFQLR